MASVGLEYVGVEVFYNSVPPRFMVSCDLVEITAQHEQVLAMMKEVGDSLFLDAIGLKDYTKKPYPLRPCQELVRSTETRQEKLSVSSSMIRTTSKRV